MTRVVLSDYPMIEPSIHREVLRDRLDEPVTVTVADLGSADRLVQAAAGDADEEPAAVVVTDVGTPVPEEALAALTPALQGVVRSAVGVSNVDVAAAAERGVAVANVPGYADDEVASHAAALLLAGLRSLQPYDEAVAAGSWDWRDGAPIGRLAEATVGIVSFGPIARRFAEQVAGFDAELLAYDPYVDPEEMAAHGVEKVGFEALFDRADHVSVHAPLTAETRGLVDADALGRLHAGSVLVNTGRGPVVDEEALLAALEADAIKAAGLDVLAEEPPADDPLVGRPDTVVTPHAAWYSEDAREEVNRRAAADAAAMIAGEEPAGRVDPEAAWL